jgi:hypothetical protein
MSIRLEFLNIVIPIASLKKCLSIRDVSEFLDERTHSGSGCWCDDDLYREGAMNDMDLDMILRGWKERGLKLTRRRKGAEEWHDLCVVDTFSGPTLPCRWIDYDPESHTVSMTAVSPGLKTALDSLKQSPLFQLSLASKELFHSNFIGWCCEVWPEQTAKIWSELVDGLPEHYSTETERKNIRREQNHHDLEIDFEGKILLVVELKVKSLALKKQLEDYAGKMKPETRLVLMSLTEPDILKNKIELGDNKIACSWVDLSVMAQKFRDECIKGENPSEAQVGKSSVKYLTGLLEDYAKYVVALKEVTMKAAKVEDGKRFFLKKADRDAITDLRLHDLVFKLRYQQLGEMVQERLPMGTKFEIKPEMSNATGMITVDLNLVGAELPGHLGQLGIGIQLQGNMFRQYLALSSVTNNKGIGEQLCSICIRLRENNLWLNEHTKVDNISSISTMRNKNEFCKFNDVFFYNYRNLNEFVSATEIANYIVEQMKCLQSKEKEIIEIVNARPIIA